MARKVESAEDHNRVAVTDPLASSQRIALETRCAAAGISIEEKGPLVENGRKFLLVHMPDGRETRAYQLWNLQSIESLLAIDFERYVYLSPFDAICSYTSDEIEALISNVTGGSPDWALARFLVSQENEQASSFEFCLKGLPSREIRISRASDELTTLFPRHLLRRRLSLKLRGFGVRAHDDAVAVLVKISDSLFFQLDAVLGVGLRLVRRRTLYARGFHGRCAEGTLKDIKFPDKEYDSAPMSLYWYGRSAVGMPLLQFLAFYQVMEFYFPSYFKAEARKEVRRIIKDPGFREDRDADIGRILATLSYRGADELSMFRATLVECVSAVEMRDFLEADEDRRKFFTTGSKGLSSHRIPIANASADLRNDVADRLYQIRCRIVHSKGDIRDEEEELLLPFSKEAEQLVHDIALIHFLAQQVLIAASSRM